jgi:penicillin-binding protein 1C
MSDVHRPVVIADATGLPACPPYAGKHVHQEIYEFWSSDLQQVFAEAGIPRRKPPHNPHCMNAGESESETPRITSPLRGSAYAMRSSQPNRNRIAFSATTDADAHTLYWFVDDAYVGRSRPGQPLFWTPSAAGRYRVRTVDDHGLSDERSLEVTIVD